MTNKYALIVDDEPILLSIHSDMLTRLGYVSETAADGQEGIERFNPEHHSVVLTDLEMPRKNGAKLINEIHEKSRVPILLTTGAGDVVIRDSLGSPLYEKALKLYTLDADQISTNIPAEELADVIVRAQQDPAFERVAILGKPFSFRQLKITLATLVNGYTAK
jgi:CheY-like chemotaxis protein